MQLVLLLILSSLFFVVHGKDKPTTRKPKFIEKMRNKVSGTKRALLSSVGKKRTFRVQATLYNEETTVLHGSLLILDCDGVTDQVEWFHNGDKVENILSEWRVQVINGQVETWPVNESDKGRYECTVNGVFKGHTRIRVVYLRDSFLQGLKHYITVSLCFLPFLIIGIWYLSTRHLGPPIPPSDPIADLLLKQVDGAQIRERMMEENEDGQVAAKEKGITAKGRRGLHARKSIRMVMGDIH